MTSLASVPALAPRPAPVHWFSTDAFLETLAGVHFAGRAFRIAPFRAGAGTFRLLEIEGEAPITRWPFLDFLAPLEGEPAAAPDEVRWVPRAVVGEREVEGRPDVAPGTEPAPYVAWERFADWGAFEAHFSRRRSSLVRDSRTKRRNLERELGPVAFRWSDDRPETFERCLEWKSAQYDRTGVVNLLRRARSAAFFRALHARGALVVSSLSAGDALLAVHLGALDEGRLYSWIASYDPERSRFSPGRLLLEDMLRESQRLGHAEWDFGIGDMDYKWHYATHDRVIGPVGRPPLAARALGAARATLRGALARHPSVLEAARRLRKRAGEAWRR